MTQGSNDAGEHPLNTRSLRYLHEVDKHGGMRAAADALGINPSVISRQISQLESVHGVAMLERRGRLVGLTEIGLTLAEHFRESSRRDADMFAQLADFKNLRRGRIGLGVGEGRVESLVTNVLVGFSEEFPDIVVELRSGGTSQTFAMVRNDEVDIGVCAAGKSDPAIQARTFRAARFCAMVSPKHPLARMERVRVEHLRDQRLIFMPERFGVQQYVNAILHAEGVNMTPSYRCDLFSAAQSIAAAGLGIAFMSTEAARQNLEIGRLVALEIDHPIAHDFSSQVIRRIGKRLSPAAAFLWRQLVDAMQRGAPAARPRTSKTGKA